MNRERLKEIMFDQKDVFNSRKHLIHRDICDWFECQAAEL
jgi:hypothetical protein